MGGGIGTKTDLVSDGGELSSERLGGEGGDSLLDCMGKWKPQVRPGKIILGSERGDLFCFLCWKADSNGRAWIFSVSRAIQANLKRGGTPCIPL